MASEGTSDQPGSASNNIKHETGAEVMPSEGEEQEQNEEDSVKDTCTEEGEEEEQEDLESQSGERISRRKPVSQENM